MGIQTVAVYSEADAAARHTQLADESICIGPANPGESYLRGDKIIAAADTAPTAGNYQGFEIFYVKGTEKKKLLVDACNKQPYVNAPVVLIFCKNPSRVKFDFPDYVLKKFAIQDATLAAGYSQLAAQALGLSSIWIGMFDEQKIMDILETDLVPSSVLCIGYPEQTKFPKPRRNLKDLVHVTW